MCFLLSFNIKCVNNISGYRLGYKHKTTQNKMWLSIDPKMFAFVLIYIIYKDVYVSNLHSNYLANLILACLLEYSSLYFDQIG